MDTFNRRIMNMNPLPIKDDSKWILSLHITSSYYFIDIASCITIRIGISSVFTIMYPYGAPPLSYVTELFRGISNHVISIDLITFYPKAIYNNLKRSKVPF